MQKEIISTGHLKMPRLDGDKSVGMCDKPILGVYMPQLKTLSKRYNEEIVWGLAPYTRQPDADVVFYLHSYPLPVVGMRETEREFACVRTPNMKLSNNNLLNLCDYNVIANLTLRGTTYEMVCGVLMMDKHKRRSMNSAQIWISEEDTSIPEEALDWFCHYFIQEGFSPIVASRTQMYNQSSIVSCGVYYKGD